MSIIDNQNKIYNDINFINNELSILNDKVDNIVLLDSEKKTNIKDNISQLNDHVDLMKDFRPKQVGDWIRPFSRPQVPDIKDGEEVVYFLMGVSPMTVNDMCFRMITADSTQFTVDWGDGTIKEYDSNLQAEHMYDYNSIQSELTEEGIKWVWIKVIPTTSGGYFTTLNIAQYKPSWRPPTAAVAYIPFLYETYIQAPKVTAIPFGTSFNQYNLCDVFDYRGINEITSFSYFLRGFKNLKLLNIDTSKGTNFQSFLTECYSIQGMTGLNLSKAINLMGFLTSCYSWKQYIDFTGSKPSSLSSFLTALYGFNQPIIGMDTSNCTDFSSCLDKCRSFNQEIDFDTSKAKTIINFLGSCPSFSRVVTVDLSSVTVKLGSAFSGCQNLRGLRLLNMNNVDNLVNIPYSCLDENALDLLIKDLYDRTGIAVGTLTITGNYGVAKLSDESKALATAKNWTLVL